MGGRNCTQRRISLGFLGTKTRKDREGSSSTGIAFVNGQMENSRWKCGTGYLSGSQPPERASSRSERCPLARACFETGATRAGIRGGFQRERNADQASLAGFGGDYFQLAVVGFNDLAADREP